MRLPSVAFSVGIFCLGVAGCATAPLEGTSKGSLDAAGRGAGGGDAGGSSPGGGDAGGSSAGGDAQPVIPESFTTLTVRGFGSPCCWGEGHCDFDRANVFVVDRKKRELSWDTCVSPADPEVVHGKRVLDELEFQAVLNTASLVVPSTADNCGNDKPGLEMEVEVENNRTTYEDDFYAGCYERDGDERFVANMDSLHSWLKTLAEESKIPPAEGELILASTQSSTSDSSTEECDDVSLPTVYRFNPAQGELTWDRCGIPGTRLLDAAEVNAVLDAYSGLHAGASAPCSELSIPPYCQMTELGFTDETGLWMIDEAGSCCPGPATGLFVVGLHQVEAVLAGLVP